MVYCSKTHWCSIKLLTRITNHLMFTLFLMNINDFVIRHAKTWICKSCLELWRPFLNWILIKTWWNLIKIEPGALESIPQLNLNQQIINFNRNRAWSDGGHSLIDSYSRNFRFWSKNEPEALEATPWLIQNSGGHSLTN